ncbi:hypothetical protein ACGVWS_10175 [Enterobacteriaceae bacterium LUAb1]
MIFKNIFSHIIINASLPGESAITGWYGRRPLIQEMLILLKQQIIPSMPASLFLTSSAKNYPCNFICSAMSIKRNQYMVGTFLPDPTAADSEPIALFSLVSHKWIQRNMAGQESLPFWLTRILTLLITEHISARRIADVREWCRLLQRMSGAGRDITLHESELQCNKLRQTICDADLEFNHDDGVDTIPWQGWPDCVRSGEDIWYWRQSRYGKIIGAHKTSLLSNLKNKV